jgi:hypothetical protein
MFEVGDVLKLKGVYVHASESEGKIDRGLIIYAGTINGVRYYETLIIPTDFCDYEDFFFKSNLRTLSETFINKNSKKIDHIDLTSFVSRLLQ